MSREHFHQRLDELRTRLLHMSRDVEDLVDRSVGLATGRGGATTADIVADDRAIDELEVSIEETAIELLALHQPMAGDLRVLVTILKINNDLERIGDHAVNIAEAAERLGRAKRPPPLPPELEEMSDLARGMLRDGLDALVHHSAEEARRVMERDDRVDRLHESLFRVMLTHMTEHNISACLQVILIGRNLERIADLATNIGEDVVYMVRGITVRHGVGADSATGDAEPGSPDP
ncbi:MAG: phosphate signaling complex protein PhoU [Gemmatimonadota bacterium]